MVKPLREKLRRHCKMVNAFTRPVRRVDSLRILILLPLLCLTSATVCAQADNLITQLQHAAALIAENRTDDAEKEITAILKTAPTEPAALNLLGTIRAKQGRFEDAETLFVRAINGDKSYVGAHMNLAYLYTLMGQPKKTVVELRTVLLLDPKE